MKKQKTKKPWQLMLFDKALKKKRKVEKLISIMNSIKGKDCLDIGTGTGAISYLLRKRGGNWTSMDNSKSCVKVAKKLLKNQVVFGDAVKTPFKKSKFDCVVGLDIIEHIKSDYKFVLEMKRILKKGGALYLTTPRTSQFLILNYIKNMVGMTPDKYGHVVAGYTKKELSEKLEKNGFKLVKVTTYSKLFTEFFELILNLIYLKLNKKKGFKGYNADISPSSEEDIKKKGMAFKLYSLFYPVLNFFSWISEKIPLPGYGLLIKAVKK